MRININLGNSNGTGRPRGIVPRGCATVFFLLFALMGLAFTAFMVRDLYKTALTYTWRSTECIIVASGIDETDDTKKPFRFAVRYTYAFEDGEYSSETYEKDYGGSSDYASVRRLTEKYKPNTKATCYVNPSNPGEAVLSRKAMWFALFIFLPLIFVAVGVGGIYCTWRGRKKRADGSPAPESISAKARSKGTNAWVAALFCAAFTVAGVVIFYFLFLRPVFKIQDAKGWAETPCRIEGAWVQSHEGDDSTTYSVEVLYAYEFGGRLYKSSRYSFGTGSSSGYEGKRAVVVRLRQNPNTVCYVNPRDPTEAVLERGYTAEIWFGLFTLLFVLFGGIGLFFTVRSIRKKTEPDAQGLAATKTPGVPEHRLSAGPVVLKSRGSRVGRLLFTLLFGAIWNGVVSVFLWQVIEGWQKGRGNWLETLFLVPFVLVGLGAIVAALYFLLALSNPRARLVVSSDAAPLGESVDLKWEMTGRAGRIGRFEISLEGREEAMYRRGTKTYTDKNVFANVPVVEIDDPRDMTAGGASFAVPPDTMHSFEAENNKIIWTLRVHGSIRFWPDVKDEFAFTVLPRPVREAGR